MYSMYDYITPEVMNSIEQKVVEATTYLQQYFTLTSYTPKTWVLNEKIYVEDIAHIENQIKTMGELINSDSWIANKTWEDGKLFTLTYQDFNRWLHDLNLSLAFEKEKPIGTKMVLVASNSFMHYTNDNITFTPVNIIDKPTIEGYEPSFTAHQIIEANGMYYAVAETFIFPNVSPYYRRFVAVGSSEDGINWRIRQTIEVYNDENNKMSIAYIKSQNKFIVINGDRDTFLVDAETFEYEISDIKFIDGTQLISNDYFVVGVQQVDTAIVSTYNDFVISTDGITWTPSGKQIVSNYNLILSKDIEGDIYGARQDISTSSYNSLFRLTKGNSIVISTMIGNSKINYINGKHIVGYYTSASKGYAETEDLKTWVRHDQDFAPEECAYINGVYISTRIVNPNNSTETSKGNYLYTSKDFVNWEQIEGLGYISDRSILAIRE